MDIIVNHTLSNGRICLSSASSIRECSLLHEKCRKMDTNSQSRGICRKLMNFIHTMLMSRTRLTNEVHIQDGSSRNEKGSIRSINKANGYVGSEIMVEFRHINGSDRVKQRGGSILTTKKDGLVLSNDPTILQNGHLDSRETKKGLLAQKFDPKIISIEGSEANKKTHDSDTTKGRDAKSKFPLTSVASNIDKKSDAYIESRLKAMRLDHESS